MHFVSQRWALAKWMGAHSYHREDDTDGAEDGLSWHDVQDVSRNIQAIDDRVQRGEDIFSAFRVFGLGIHGFRASAEVNGRCKRRVVRRMPSPGP